MVPSIVWFLVHGSLMFLYADVACAGYIDNGVGIARNLTVEPIRDEGWAGHNGKYQALRLNVSWLPPNDGRQPSSYSILIINSEHNTAACPEESLYYASRTRDELSVVLPENQHVSDIPEMHFYPNCSYKIQVFANPRMKATQKAEVIFTVPDCMDDEPCSCRATSANLPIPDVHVTINTGDLRISWHIASQNSFVKSYLISVGLPILISKSGNPVYNITKVISVTANHTVYTWHTPENGANGGLHGGGKIFVAAVDQHGCTGPAGSYIIRLEEKLNFLESKGIWLIFIGGVCGCALFGIFKVMSVYGRKYQSLWSSESFIRMRTVMPKRSSDWAESILLNHNILYSSYTEGVDEYEVPYKNVRLTRSLGAGQFGKVYLGYVDESKKKLVAVKVSQDINSPTGYEERQQLIEEINIMKMAGPHPHLVQLIGYCTLPQKPVCIILEYMQGGDLLAYLHFRRGSKQNQAQYRTVDSQLLCIPGYTTLHSRQQIATNTCTKDTVGIEAWQYSQFGPTDRDLFIKFALDIARGMEHLEARGITHRDLAARNILLTSDFTLKISDFGLSRNGIYVIRNTEKRARHLPIRWMSPEALRERAFTSKGDVWSFAIVLWEIGTLGTFPYPHIEDKQLLQHVVYEQCHPEKPDSVCPDIYQLMRSCWSHRAEERPSFAQLVLDLQVLRDPLHSIHGTSNPCYTVLTHMKDNE